jgi:hypothetical protein
VGLDVEIHQRQDRQRTISNQDGEASIPAGWHSHDGQNEGAKHGQEKKEARGQKVR